MSRAKEGIYSCVIESGLLDRFANFSTRIYERWENQMRNDLHVAAHILNPQFGFGREFDRTKEEVRLRLGPDNVLDKMVLDLEDWWFEYGLKTINLKEIATRIVTQSCGASGYECNWSIFEYIHLKKRNWLIT